MHLRFSQLSLFLASSLAASAVQSAPDKSRYTFFNPTPEALMREMSTDRPDATESPYTVDAGHYQIESDLLARSRDHDKADGADTVTTAWLFSTLNFKFGITNRIDLQTVVEPYTRIETDDHVAATNEKLDGFGDITSRLKINLWGNDGGDTAAALMPFVKWPTASNGLGNDKIEGGLIFPIAFTLSSGWSLGIMTELDVVRNADDDGYTTEWVNTATVSHDIAGDLGGYLELTSTLTEGRDLATFNCGLTYGINNNTQFDLGTNIALTDATEDLVVFLGLSIRY
jgi:Putative MetA-pathway of phenol degradation